MPTLEIPQGLYDAFARRAKEKNFSSTEEYIAWVLAEIAKKMPAAEPGKNSTTVGQYTEEEEQLVKDRLRGLGYID